MNTCFQKISLIGLALATVAMGQAPRALTMERLRVTKQEVPVFPFELVQLGVREGKALIGFSVDANGQIDECFPIAYTHKEFADVSVAAVRRWKFEPARIGGEPVGASSQVTVNFETQGPTVVSLTGGEALALWMNSLHRDAPGYFPRTLRELDRIPTPVATPAPAYSHEFVTRGHVGTVTVDFYIDEAGAVRLPSTESTEDPQLAALAITALRQWKFEPPRCQGRPVLVKASQVFRFLPNADAMQPKTSD